MTQERKVDVEGMEQRKKAIVLGGTVPHIELIRQLYGALHAVAEACGLSKNDPHSGAPPTA